MKNSIVFLFVVGALLFSISCHAGRRYPVNELPMNGGVEKTASMREADERLLAAVDAEGQSREKTSEYFSQQGWEAFSKQEYASAMRRFNQAWLLSPDNYQSYWGFALIVLLRDQDAAQAAKLFETAASLNPGSGNFYIEYGRFTEEILQNPDQAIALFEQGLHMNPRIKDGYVGLIRCYIEKKDIKMLRHWTEQALVNDVMTDKDVEPLKELFRKYD